MNLTQQYADEAAVAVAFAENPENLQAFLEPGCAAAIWNRRVDSSLQAWLDNLDPKQLPSGRLVLPVEAVPSALTELCNLADTPNGVGRQALIDDVATLANVFANLLGSKYLRLRLDVASETTCPKFHIDAVTARLICTYRGPGTQYGIAPNGGEPAQVFTVPTSAPIILHGSQSPQPPTSGLLHRSPPIEGSGQTRFVVVLDPFWDMGPRPSTLAVH